MAVPVWQFRLSVGNKPLFSVTVRTQGCQTFPNAHPWASHPIALTRSPWVIDDLNFPNGIAVSPDNARLAIGDCTASRMVYAIFATGPTLSNPGAKPDPLHLTFQTVRAATYLPGAGCPDGLHYDVKGNLWIAAGGLGGILQVDPRSIIVGFVPIPNGDLSTTNFAFGGPDNKTIYFMGANSGTFWRFTAPYPGLIARTASGWPRNRRIKRARSRGRPRDRVNQFQAGSRCTTFGMTSFASNSIECRHACGFSL